MTELPLPTVLCRYCEQPAKLVSGEVIHGASFKDKMFWLCEPCDAWTNTIPNSNYKPSGLMADKKLRTARRNANQALDRLIRKRMHGEQITFDAGRSKVFRWLQGKMVLPKHDCRIGLFTVEQCEVATGLCIEQLNNLGGDNDNAEKKI